MSRTFSKEELQSILQRNDPDECRQVVKAVVAMDIAVGPSQNVKRDTNDARSGICSQNFRWRIWLVALIAALCCLALFLSPEQSTSSSKDVALRKNEPQKSSKAKEVSITAPPPPAPPPAPPIDYDQLMDQECECRFPFIKTYNKVYDALVSAMVKEQQALNSNETLSETKARVFNPSDHITNDFVRRFLKFWHQEVTAMQPATNSSSSVPEARVLIIGDSVMRNVFHALITVMIHEGLAVSDEYVQMRGGYHALSITWPDPKGSTSTEESTPAVQAKARLYIRFEYHSYFASDNYDIHDSGAAAFDPTHMMMDRGLWDTVHSNYHDPSWSLASFSAGLVKLRQRLLLNRMKKAMKGDTLRLPATRIVYFGMTKIYGPDEGADIKNKEKQCTLGKDVGPFRDALYCAVRRANGALAAIHEQGAESVCREMVRVISTNDKSGDDAALQVCQEHLSNFSNLAIELLDMYAPTLAGSVSRMSDGYHPNPWLNKWILESLFNRLQRRPKPVSEAEKSVSTDLNDACATEVNTSPTKCGAALGNAAQMYVPSPLMDRGTKPNRCVLAMPPADATAVWTSTYGHPVEPPPLHPSKRELVALQEAFISQMRCPVSSEGETLLVYAESVIAKVKEESANAAAPQVPWRVLLDRCLSLSMIWNNAFGSFGHWAPFTLHNRRHRGSFKSLTQIDLGIPHRKRLVVHAAGRICMGILAELTPEDFSEIWDMATNGTLSCHRAAVVSVIIRPPGVPHFPVSLKRAAECRNSEAKRDD